MDLTNCKVMKHEYTYKDLTKPSNRENMRKLGVTTLGTKSGGFGPFQPQFKVVSLDATAEIEDELIELIHGYQEKQSFSDALEKCPTLKELLK